jgi:ABC-type transport system involved in multi-copper enzyme maturation permease subunit
MTAALRAEWLKLVTTRTFRGLLYSAIVVGVLAAFIGTAQGPPPWDVTKPLHTGTAWWMGALTVIILAVIVGSRTVTEEFTHHTIVHTFVADPERRRSVIAKALIAAGAAILIAAVTAAAIGASVYGLAAITGGDLAMFASDAPAVLGLLVAAAALGVIGAGVGALVRQPVPAIVGALLWLFVVENLVSLLAGGAAGYLPGKLATALAGVPTQGAGAPLTVAAAGMAAYAVLLAIAGMFELRRRDVL